MATHYIGQGAPLNLALEDGTETTVIGWEVFEFRGKVEVKPLTADMIVLPRGARLVPQIQVVTYP